MIMQMPEAGIEDTRTFEEIEKERAYGLLIAQLHAKIDQVQNDVNIIHDINELLQIVGSNDDSQILQWYLDINHFSRPGYFLVEKYLQRIGVVS